MDQLFGSMWLEMEMQVGSPFHPADPKNDEAPLLLGVPRADRLPPVPRPLLSSSLSAEEKAEREEDPALASATSHIPRAPQPSAETGEEGGGGPPPAGAAGDLPSGRAGGDEDEEFAPDAAATAEGEEYEEEEEEEFDGLDDEDDLDDGGEFEEDEEDEAPRRKRKRPAGPASVAKPRPKPRAEPASATVPLRKMSHRQILNRLRRKR